MKSLHLLAFVALPDTQTDYNWVRDEWTEGSYLEPDTVNGMAYLEAIKSVFK